MTTNKTTISRNEFSIKVDKAFGFLQLEKRHNRRLAHKTDLDLVKTAIDEVSEKFQLPGGEPFTRTVSFNRSQKSLSEDEIWAQHEAGEDDPSNY